MSQRKPIKTVAGNAERKNRAARKAARKAQKRARRINANA